MARSTSIPSGFAAIFSRWAIYAVAAFAALLASERSIAEESNTWCPELRHGYGPYDYRTATPDQKQLVEGAHFFPAVENLKRKALHPNRGYVVVVGGELDYTLRAFPNHPRALNALSRLSIRDKSNMPEGTKATVECYFASAIRFRPDDSEVRMVYGIHLLRIGQNEKAIEQLKKAEEMGAVSANAYYNLGLAYFDLKRYPESLAAAQNAYGMGFPLPGLKKKLTAAGIWRDPPSPANPAQPTDSN